MSKPVVAFLDIETAPLEVACWGLWEQNIGLEMVGEEWSILSVAWQYEGGKMNYADTRDQKNVRDDRVLLTIVWDLLNEVDILVAQNGNSFDIKKLNARFIMNGFPPPSPYRSIDTKLVAKSVAAFTSNKLEWMAEHVAGTTKLKHHDFPGFTLWKEVLKGNPKAWATMEKYNRQDVKALRELYLKLRPWVKNHPNVTGFDTSELTACPRCGSTKLKPRGYSYTNLGKYQRYVCGGCGGWSKAGTNLLPKTKRQAMLRSEG